MFCLLVAMLQQLHKVIKENKEEVNHQLIYPAA
jgi:hypothetical protein